MSQYEILSYQDRRGGDGSGEGKKTTFWEKRTYELRSGAKKIDQTVDKQWWIPFFMRSFVRIARMGLLRRTGWAFRNEIKALDEITPDDKIQKTYAKQLSYWRGRFDEISSSMQQYVRRMVLVTYVPLFGAPLIFGVGGAFGLVYFLALPWWWGIPIFLAIACLTFLIAWGILAALSSIGVSQKLRGYSDVLLVNSLRQMLHSAFQCDPNNLAEEAETRASIVRGIEESAKWLRYLPSTLPSKDSAFKDWYYAQMDEAARKLLALRQYAIMCKPRSIEELREQLMDYFDAALLREYGKLVPEEVKLPPKTTLGKAGQVASWSITSGSLLAFIVLLVIDLATGPKLQYLEALGGTVAVPLLALFYKITGGRRGISEKRSYMELLSGFISNIEEES